VSSYWEGSDFIKTRDAWYRRLDEVGFDDIEVHEPGWVEPRYGPLYRPTLRCHDGPWVAERYNEDAAEYYRAAGSWLHDSAASWSRGPAGRLERWAWGQHAEGAKVHEITSGAAAKRGLPPTTYWAVYGMLQVIRADLIDHMASKMRKDVKRARAQAKAHKEDPSE